VPAGDDNVDVVVELAQGRMFVAVWFKRDAAVVPRDEVAEGSCRSEEWCRT